MWMPLSSLFLCEVEQLQEVQSFTPGYTALLQRTGDSEWNPLLQVRQNSCYACQKSTVNHPRSEGRTVLFPTLSASSGFVHDWQQKRRWFGIWESERCETQQRNPDYSARPCFLAHLKDHFISDMNLPWCSLQLYTFISCSTEIPGR